MKLFQKAALALGALICMSGGPAAAATLNFNLGFDGVDLSYADVSDRIEGATLAVGDSFSLTVSANNDDSWRLNGPLINSNLPLALATIEPAFRTGDLTTTWFLDGAEVRQDTQSGLSQAFNEIGAQSWTLPGGFEFDAVAVDYTLTDSQGTVLTTLTEGSGSALSLQGQPFFSAALSQQVEYVTAVPLPASLPLALAAFLGLGLVARRRS